MRYFLILAGLIAFLLLSLVLAVSFGSESIPFDQVLQVISARLIHTSGSYDSVSETIIWDLRLPRVLLALIVGGGLSITGVTMQALVRNPLADPYILGISSGASAGAALFYLGFLPFVFSQELSVPVAAFAGSFIAITVVYLVARSGNSVSVARLLLAGVAISSFMAAITSFVTLASPDANRVRAVLFWLLGSFNNTQWNTLPGPLGVTLGSLVLLLLAARSLDALLVGEEPAFNLGVPVELLKRLLIFVAALVTGVLVSASGAIGFVGLIIPHAVRSLIGVSHSRLVPLSFLTGGIFLVWADLGARTILPGEELPVGILTALCGVPFFLFLLRKSRYQFG